MAEKKFGSPSYGKIEHESGKRTYKFALNFVTATGIDAKLDAHSGACIDDERSDVSFSIHDGGLFCNSLFFTVHPDGQAQVKYNRIIAKNIAQAFEHADLRSVIMKICGDTEYCFGDFQQSGMPCTGIGILANVPTGNYRDFARFVSTIDQMISLYLHREKPVQTK